MRPGGKKANLGQGCNRIGACSYCVFLSYPHQFRNRMMIRVLRGYASFRRGLAALSAIAIGMTLASSAAAATIALPAKYKQQGELTFAFNAAYAPMEFIANDGKTMIGLDIDLANAIAKKLGVKAKFVQAGFDTIIPGLQSDRYDLSMSSFTITKKREEVMDFVSYFTAGTSFYVKAKGGPAVASLGDLCGLSVAVTKGTIQSEDATKQNQECKAAGKKGVDVQFYPDQNAASLAMDSGRAQVCMADSPGGWRGSSRNRAASSSFRVCPTTPRPTVLSFPRTAVWPSRCCRRSRRSWPMASTPKS
jgi:amino acid ABC transporter substrate-binding protein, PAAT family (TC 3.A.1.3.-)